MSLNFRFYSEYFISKTITSQSHSHYLLLASLLPLQSSFRRKPPMSIPISSLSSLIYLDVLSGSCLLASQYLSPLFSNGTDFLFGKLPLLCLVALSTKMPKIITSQMNGHQPRQANKLFPGILNLEKNDQSYG